VKCIFPFRYNETPVDGNGFEVQLYFVGSQRQNIKCTAKSIGGFEKTY